MLLSTSQRPVLFLDDLLNVTPKPTEVSEEPPTLCPPATLLSLGRFPFLGLSFSIYKMSTLGHVL